MLKDMGRLFGQGEPAYDITFENVQAGFRTDYFFRPRPIRWGSPPTGRRMRRDVLPASGRSGGVHTIGP